ncbi:hypothetical protein LJK87_15130 [Paenibacillus sp. P25]|nr:hypothetical protein LJK87_15130 [Paenibacillus sp. P25]
MQSSPPSGRNGSCQLPPTLTLKDSMSIGTAGFTAMLCIMALEEAGIAPSRGEVVVTGAGGGVGGIAISLLSDLGYSITAVSRRSELDDYLKALGASTVVRPEELGDPRKPLHSERWAGAIDTVGGELLALLLSQTAYEGAWRPAAWPAALRCPPLCCPSSCGA